MILTGYEQITRRVQPGDPDAQCWWRWTAACQRRDCPDDATADPTDVGQLCLLFRLDWQHIVDEQRRVRGGTAEGDGAPHRQDAGVDTAPGLCRRRANVEELVHRPRGRLSSLLSRCAHKEKKSRYLFSYYFLSNPGEPSARGQQRDRVPRAHVPRRGRKNKEASAVFHFDVFKLQSRDCWMVSPSKGPRSSWCRLTGHASRALRAWTRSLSSCGCRYGPKQFF